MRIHPRLALLLMLLVATGCRVTTPQCTLREGAAWFPPTFPYLHGQIPPTLPSGEGFAPHYRPDYRVPCVQCVTPAATWVGPLGED